MKTLLIMRHAKSSWEREGQPDHERPLNDRGIRDAPRMGVFLKKQGCIPEVILTSSAKRAQQTAEAVAEVMDCSDRIEVVDALYLADPLIYLAALKMLPNDSTTAMIIGHNPGISGFTSKLTRRTVELPTAAVACVSLRIDDWRGIDGGVMCEMRGLWLPRELED